MNAKAIGCDINQMSIPLHAIFPLVLHIISQIEEKREIRCERQHICTIILQLPGDRENLTNIPSHITGDLMTDIINATHERTNPAFTSEPAKGIKDYSFPS